MIQFLHSQSQLPIPFPQPFPHKLPRKPPHLPQIHLQFLIKQIMQQTEYHSIRLSVTILRTTLSVRFPCSIHYQLKHGTLQSYHITDSQTAQSRTDYQLKNGCSESHQKLVLDFDVEIVGGEYCDARAMLHAGLISANGKVPAGSVTIPVAENGQLLFADREETKNIEKCADKAAKVVYRLKIQFIRSIKRNKDSVQLTKSAVKFKPVITHSNSQMLNLKTLQTATRKFPLAGSHVTKNRTMTQKQKYLVERKNTTRTGQNSQHQRSENPSERNSQYGLQEERQEEIGESRVRISQWDRISKQNPSERSKIEPKYYNYQIDEKLSKYKAESQQLLHQLTLTREKNKNLQRKQRQYVQQIRQLKDQTDKMRSKSTITQTHNFQTKLLLQQKQRTIARLIQQLKILKQHIEQINSSANLQEKKIDYKQSVLNEQLRKLNEKYQASETQRQKMMIEMNNMLIQFESSQKKTQAQYKDKERTAMEERNRLMKKIEAMNVVVTRLEEQNGELRAQVLELKSNNSHASKSKSELEEELGQLSANLKNVTSEHKKLQQKYQIALKQLNQIRTHNQTLEKTSKKYQQLTIQHTKLKDSQHRLSSKVESCTKSLKDLESTLKQVSTAKESTVQKNYELTKQTISLRKMIQNKENQISKLQEQYVGLGRKNQELKGKYSTQNAYLEQQIKKYQKQISYLSKLKQTQQEQYQQLKWRYSKTEETLEALCSKGSQTNEKILTLNEELINQQNRIKDLRQSNKQLQNTIELLKSEVISREQKQQQLAHQLKCKNELEYENSKILKTREQEIAALRDRQIYLQGLNEEAKKKIDELISNISKIESQFGEGVQEYRKKIEKFEVVVNEQRIENERYKDQCGYLKGEKGELEARVRSLEIQVLATREIVKQKEKQIGIRAETEKKMYSQSKKKEQQLATLKQQFKKYKSDMATSFESFASQFIKQTEVKQPQSSSSSSPTIKKQRSLIFTTQFTEQYFLNFQTKLIKSIHALHSKYGKELRTQAEVLQNTNVQLAKMRDYAKNAEENNEKYIQQQKQKYNQLINVGVMQKNELQQKIRVLQESLHYLQGQKQKLGLILQAVQQQFQDNKKSLEQSINEKQQADQKIARLENDKKQLSKQYDNLKKNGNAQILASNQEYKLIIQKQKNNVRQLEKKLYKSESQLRQQQKSIKNLENSLSQKCYELDRTIKNFSASHKSAQELKAVIKTVREQYNQCQAKIVELVHGNEELVRKLDAEVMKNYDLSQKLKKSAEDYNQLSQENESVKTQNRNLVQAIQSTQTKYKKLLQNQQKVQSKQSLSLKQHQQLIISLKSDLQLKQFLIKQLENNYNDHKNQTLALNQQNNTRKDEIVYLNQIIDNVKNENLCLRGNIQALEAERNGWAQEERNLKQRLEKLTMQSNEAGHLENLLESQKKQNQKLKTQITILASKLKNTTKQLSDASTQFKKQTLQRSSKQDQLKKKIRQLQKQISNRIHESTLQNQRNQQQYDQEKLNLFRQLQLLQQQNQRLTSFYNNLKLKSQNQFDVLNQECAELTGLLTQKQQLLCAKDQRIVEQENKNKLLMAEIKGILEAWQTQRRESQIRRQGNKTQIRATKIMNEIDARSRHLFSIKY